MSVSLSLTFRLQTSASFFCNCMNFSCLITVLIENISCLFTRGGTGLRFSSSDGLGLCLFELGTGSGLGSILKFKLGRARALHFRARVGLGPRPKYVKKLWISSFKT